MHCGKVPGNLNTKDYEPASTNHDHATRYQQVKVCNLYLWPSQCLHQQSYTSSVPRNFTHSRSFSGLSVLVGASLNEPHTSVTSLRACVCMLVCLLACLLAWTDHIPEILNMRFHLHVHNSNSNSNSKRSGLHGVLIFFMFFNADGSSIRLNHDGVAECEGKIAS